MKTELIDALKEEKANIEAEIARLNEELIALDIVINRKATNTNTNTATIVSAKPHNDNKSEIGFTKGEQRIIDAINSIGGKVTVRQIFEYLASHNTDQNVSNDKLHSIARQFTSGMARKGKINVDKNKGNKPSYYYLKQ